MESKQNVFLCSMHDDNWDICVKHKLWGVPETSLAAISAISRSKPGDILLFRLNKGKKNKKVWEEFISIWIVTSKAQQVIDGGPWKKENPDDGFHYEAMGGYNREADRGGDPIHGDY